MHKPIHVSIGFIINSANVMSQNTNIVDLVMTSLKETTPIKGRRTCNTYNMLQLQKLQDTHSSTIATKERRLCSLVAVARQEPNNTRRSGARLARKGEG